MLDPQAVLGQARQGRVPANWRVFTKARGRVRGFLRGTSADPDPLLVITPNGVVEYVDSKKPVAAVDFDSLSGISLRVSGSTFSDSIQVRLDVWLDVHYRDGRKSKWRSASFAGRGSVTPWMPRWRCGRRRCGRTVFSSGCSRLDRARWRYAYTDFLTPPIPGGICCLP